jgi:hypothetical protein
MSTDPTSESRYGIIPNKAYRKSDRETQDIIGLGPTQTDEEIRNGTLPPPAPLTKNGKAAAWWGFQLIQYIDERRKLAHAREAKRVPPKPRASSRHDISTPPRPRPRLSKAPPRPTAKPKKTKLRR